MLVPQFWQMLGYIFAGLCIWCLIGFAFACFLGRVFGLNSDEEKMVTTLPDGRHRTNLKVLLQQPSVKEHLKWAAKVGKDDG